jgi:hypothetical protein
MLKNADAAMYKAKAAGGSTYVIHGSGSLPYLKFKELS